MVWAHGDMLSDNTYLTTWQQRDPYVANVRVASSNLVSCSTKNRVHTGHMVYRLFRGHG